MPSLICKSHNRKYIAIERVHNDAQKPTTSIVQNAVLIYILSPRRESQILFSEAEAHKKRGYIVRYMHAKKFT